MASLSRLALPFTCLTAVMAILLAQPGTPPVAPPPVVSVRIVFGLTDAAPTQWDGTVQLDGGAVKAIQGVRFGPEDSTDYSTSWKTATRMQGQDVLENGVTITATAKPDARWNIHTARGDFSFTLLDLPWGEERSFLDGAVEVDRVPPTSQLTTSDDDEDFPAMAQAKDGMWLAYVRFAHSTRTQESFQQLRAPLDNFDYLARPAGGDQVLVAHYTTAASGAATGGTWAAPVPVSPKGETITRTAIAIDGQNRVWVVWSAGRDGNFDLYGRVGTPGRSGVAWGPEKRITSAAGPDLSPVATTDSKGRVWIAWQGYRNGNLEILAAMQNGDGFPAETVVSDSPASDWDPAIAAAPDGDVAISWDTYDKGDYDVYFRRMRPGGKAGIELDRPVAAAATPLFEAHSSVAFDAANRLWLAYEVSTARWGKNFGVYDTTGTPLYEDRNIRVKCFEGSAAFATSADLLNVLPGTPIAPARSPRTRPNRLPLQPNPNMGRNRRAGQGMGPRPGPLNSFPRIATGPAGGVYVAFRTLARPVNLRSPLGSIWTGNVVYFDGHKWAGPVFLPRSDGLLEGRPALVAREANHLFTVSAMDHRQSTPQGVGQGAAERINSDLYMADLLLADIRPAAKPELVALAKDPAEPADPRLQAEGEQIARVRDYRIAPGGQTLKILRGESHRHTEYSIDGTRDGSLDDAYRYMIDAAGLDWGACCDYENGEGHEYFWWREQTMAEAYRLPDRFTPMFAFEHPVRYPEGHRMVLFARRGIRPLPHLPPLAADAPADAVSADTQMLYRYLKAFGGISIPHASATDQGTDWRSHDAAAEPAVEIYQGNRQSYEKEDGPRAAKPGDALSNLRPAGYVTAALDKDKGYRLGFVAGSDHHSTHIAFSNVLVPDKIADGAPVRDAILDAFRKRHVYASTDHIVADVRSGDHVMGDEFLVNGAPAISVRLLGTAAFAAVVIVKDGKEVYRTEPKTRDVKFEWKDNAFTVGKTSYYYVRGEQEDGQLVWVSPMWIGSK